VNDELMRRISDAQDADGVDADAELRSLLARDPEARAYADDLVRVDAALQALGEHREPDFDALADRISARLDEKLDEGFDPTAAPFFTDDPGDRPVGLPEKRAAAPVVELASRRGSRVFYWLGGLAAAAAVLLGISLGLTTLGAENEVAMSPVSELEEQGRGAFMPAPAPAPMQVERAAGEAAQAEMPRREPVAQIAPTEPSAEPALAMPPPSPTDSPVIVAELARPDEARMQGGGFATQPARARPQAQQAAPTISPRAQPMEPEPMERGSNAGPVGRADVLAALRAVEAPVQRCIAERREVARVSISVQPNGSIGSIQVMPPFVGADAQCIESAVRSARLPASEQGYVFVHAFRPAGRVAGTLARPPNAARQARQRAYEAAPPPSAVDNAFRE
jgi:hypothetical protein